MAPKASVVHLVRDDLLTQARIAGVDALVDPMLEVLGSLADADAVLCTCSTLGPLVDLVNNPRFIRIDRPLMEAAAAIGPRPLVVVTLESAREAVEALLMDVRGPDVEASILICDEAWSAYVAGDLEGYAAMVADHVQDIWQGHDCVVLAQASLAGVPALLHGVTVPVLTAPELAVARVLAVAG